ncbi:hypothetical protein FKM82_025829 [Ascaphus truei]
MDMENHMADKDDTGYDNTEATFSDDDEELNSKGKKREFRFHPIKEAIIEEPVDITPYLDQLDESLKDKVVSLQKGTLVLLFTYTQTHTHTGRQALRVKEGMCNVPMFRLVCHV